MIMRKIFIIGVVILGVFLTSAQGGGFVAMAGDSPAPAAPAPPPSPAVELKDISERADIAKSCHDVRQKMPASVPGTPSGNINYDRTVSVYLSESIEKQSQMSCSQIIYCLRTKPLKKGDKRISGAEQEMLVISTLRTHFKECLIEGKDGLDLLKNYATMVYKWIAGLVGAVCILTIVLSGIQISIGGLSQEEVSGAKDRIGRSLIGMVVLFLSAFILYTINPIFFT
jgi:hypothetical protein